MGAPYALSAVTFRQSNSIDSLMATLWFFALSFVDKLTYHVVVPQIPWALRCARFSYLCVFLQYRKNRKHHLNNIPNLHIMLGLNANRRIIHKRSDSANNHSWDLRIESPHTKMGNNIQTKKGLYQFGIISRISIWFFYFKSLCNDSALHSKYHILNIICRSRED